MKLVAFGVLAAVLVACNPRSEQRKPTYVSPENDDLLVQPMTDEEEAANKLYLGDTVESAGDDEIVEDDTEEEVEEGVDEDIEEDTEDPVDNEEPAQNDDVSKSPNQNKGPEDDVKTEDKGKQPEKTEDPKTDSSDPSVEEDCRDRRLEQMANMVLDKLDADNSGSLSLDEFLSILDKMKLPVHGPRSAERLAKIKAKLTEDFKKAAGDDLELSKDELKDLLKSAKGRVGKLRRIKFPGKHADRIKKKADEIIKQHDKDGDGKISAEELEEALQGRMDQCNRWKKRRPPMPMPNKPTTDSGKMPQDKSGDSMGKTKDKFRH